MNTPLCRRLAAFLASLTLFSPALHAETWTWTTSGSTDWTTTGNWAEAANLGAATGSPHGTDGNTYIGVRLNINGTVNYTATQGTQTYDVSAGGGENRVLVISTSNFDSGKSLILSGTGANLILIPESGTPSILVGAGLDNGFAGQASLIVNNGATLKQQTSVGAATGVIDVLSRGTATARGTLTVSGAGSLVSTDRVSFGGLAAPTAGALASVNINSGGTLLTRLIAANANSNSSSYATVNFDGGTLKSGDTDNSETLISSANSLAVKLLSGGGTIDTNGQTGQTVDAVISGIVGGSFTKAGTGTLTLSAANTYDGSTLITGGTLALGASGSLSGSNLINISSGATFSVSAQTYTLAAGKTLRGAGNITGAVSMAGTSTIAGGVDASTLGTLTFNNSLSSASGATFSLKLNSNTGLSDAIAAAGISLNGATLSLTDLGSTTLSGPTVFTLLHSTSTSVTGTFAGLNEGASITVGNNSYIISYSANGGTDVTLTASAIPEPSTLAAVLGAMVFTGALCRRRARTA